MKGMSYCVTGGAGFIGQRLVSRLLDAGATVRVLDLEAAADPRAESVIGSILDPDAMARALRGVDTVFHLAAVHADDVRPSTHYYVVNVEGTRALLKACSVSDVRRLVFTSTVAVYGLQLDGADEDAPPVPFNDYGASKLQAEQVVAHWATADDRNRAVIVRPCVVIGPGNRGNVHKLFNQIRRRGPLVIGNGANRKSMAYVDNVADFLLHCGTANSQLALYNYADKPDLSTAELVTMVAPALGHAESVRHVPYLLALAIGYLCDAVAWVTRRRFAVSAVRVRKFCASSVIDSSRALTSGFEPRHSLTDGVQAMLAAMTDEKHG
jgi:nucleoside-diphosphate-sugar epimerase